MENGESKQQPLHLQDSSSSKKPSSSSLVDRLKRDEWSEGAVSSLLEAYETKWVLRNRAKLKGQDWEDVAKHVSSRSNHTKSPKTQTQCKNKIESMKKRYRSESATSPEASSWPLYSRLDHLLRGTTTHPPQVVQPLNCSVPLLLLEPPSSPTPTPAPAPAAPPPEQPDLKPAMETDSSTSTPVKVRGNKLKRRKCKEEIAGSIRWLAEVVMRSERARMETMKEIEKMRAEAEVKRGEIDLKRTEILANTQLEIAKLFAVSLNAGHKGVDSSLRIGRS